MTRLPILDCVTRSLRTPHARHARNQYVRSTSVLTQARRAIARDSSRDPNRAFLVLKLHGNDHLVVNAGAVHDHVAEHLRTALHWSVPKDAAGTVGKHWGCDNPPRSDKNQNACPNNAEPLHLILPTSAARRNNRFDHVIICATQVPATRQLGSRSSFRQDSSVKPATINLRRMSYLHPAYLVVSVPFIVVGWTTHWK
jgi:hypothetical protein